MNTIFLKIILTIFVFGSFGYGETSEKPVEIQSKSSDRKSFEDSLSTTMIDEDIKSLFGRSRSKKSKDSLRLGTAFKNWKLTNSYEEGRLTLDTWIPPYNKGEYIIECLEILSMQNPPFSLEKMIDIINQDFFQNHSAQKLEFPVFSQSPREIIYSCVYPKDNLQVSCIARGFLIGDTFYHIRYKRGSPNHMKYEKLLYWKEQVESIKIR